jgi:tetratricopeptide (TPR) repeat protein
MICHECKKEIEDGSLFCNNCGTRLSEDNEEVENVGDKTTDRPHKVKKLMACILEKFKAIDQEHIKPFREKLMVRIGQNKKAYTLYSALALVVIAAVIVGTIYFNDPLRKIERLYNNGEYDKAELVYSRTISREKNAGKRETLNNNLKDFFTKMAVKTEEDYAEGKISYQEAVDCVKNIKEFWFAEHVYELSIDEINKLRDSKASYEAGLKKLADNNIIEGVKELSKVIREDPNYDDAKKQITNALPSLRKQALLEAENAYKAKDYQGAIDFVELVSEYIKDDTEIKEKLEFYNAENEKALAQRKKELLSKTTSNYDDMKDETIIVPAGYSTGYVNVSGSVNIYPMITVDSSGKASFYIFAGFEQPDWIFFDHIIFNADGNKFTWLFDYGEPRRKVLWGTISEWAANFQGSVETIDVLDELNIHPSNMINTALIQEMTQLSSAKTAKMRFQGQGYRDHVLTSHEKENIKIFIELYNCYEHV